MDRIDISFWHPLVAQIDGCCVAALSVSLSLFYSMKGLAFVYDPDGYWVELVKRDEQSGISNEYNFSQTMLRVKDPIKSLEFYQRLGMHLLHERHFDDFSLYFLASSNVPHDNDTNVKKLFAPVLELTHNHGTETNNDFRHYNGNEEGRQGFGHVGFLVDDVYQACDAIRKMGYGFRKVSVVVVVDCV